MKEIIKILIVCTGNTCRSPMAQVMASEIFGDGYEIISAGVMAMPGSPASTHAIVAMGERGLNLSDHKSMKVSETIVRDADIILVMTSSHKAALSHLVADRIDNKVQVLGVSDPFGGDLSVYRRCAEEIYEQLMAVQNRMKVDDLGSFDNLHVTEHPLVESKLTLLRDKDTGNKEFRELVREIATFICYEATRDAPLREKEIETPLKKTKARVTNRKYAIVPILRAGMGMVDGVSNLLPTAKIGHIGMYRDPDSLEPVEYYCKLPPDSIDREILLLDPMIATGGTTDAAISYLKKNNICQIKLLSLLASPEGVKRLGNAHPDVIIYTASLDERLDDQGYIVPGLGDAGDRLFGTK